MVSDWVVDTKAQAVIHKETGLIVRFRRRGVGAWDGEAENQDVLLPQLSSFGSQWVARLMRQAGDVFAIALERSRHSRLQSAL
jgi:hypothetical protein